LRGNPGKLHKNCGRHKKIFRIRIICIRDKKAEEMMLNTLKECPYYLISRLSLSVTAALKKEFASSGIEQVKPVPTSYLKF
jgi:hypothetical protein